MKLAPMEFEAAIFNQTKANSLGNTFSDNELLAVARHYNQNIIVMDTETNYV